jgi:hypothetical protein
MAPKVEYVVFDVDGTAVFFFCLLHYIFPPGLLIDSEKLNTRAASAFYFLRQTSTVRY